MLILYRTAGDAMVRELDVSRITIRLTEKVDNKGEGGEEHVYAKLTGQTLDVLRQGLVRRPILASVIYFR